MNSILPEWFNINSISSNELNIINNKFKNSFIQQNLNSYKLFRNSIIELYIQHPNTKLTFTSCRRNMYNIYYNK